jgi:hypothetical protein
MQAEKARVELLGQENAVFAGDITVMGPIRTNENAFNHKVILSLGFKAVFILLCLPRFVEA